jgi:hypothetical protein
MTIKSTIHRGDAYSRLPMVGGIRVFDDLSDNYIEMRDLHQHSESSGQIELGGSSLAFAAFVQRHSGCGEEVSESRLDECSLVGWCSRCEEFKLFTIGEGSRKKSHQSHLFSEGGPAF